MKKVIKTDSAQCGAGKTTSIVDLVNNTFIPLKEGVIIIQPSIIAINETQAKIPGSIAIHSGNCVNVAEEIYKHIYGEKKVLIITHQAFLMLDIVLPQWHLIIDEEIDPVQIFKLNLCDTADKLQLTDYYTFRDSDITGYKIVEAKDEAQVLKMAESNDDVMKLFKSLNESVASQYHDVYITDDMVNKFTDSDGMLFAHALLRKDKFDHFKSVRFYGARFEESFLTKILGFECNVTRAFTQHNGKNVNIHYADNNGWSKNANINHADKKEVFLNYVKSHVTDKAIYLDNNDQTQLASNSTFERLNHNPHGINKYNNLTQVVVMSAINPHNATIKFLKDVCGLNKYDIKQHYMASLYYQTVMRTALRNKHNDKKVDIYCLDGQIAMYLDCEYFSGANVIKIEGTTIEYKAVEIPLTQAERNKATAIRKVYNETLQYNARELKSMLIWDYTSVRGKLTNEALQVLMNTGDDVNALLVVKDEEDMKIGVVHSSNTTTLRNTPSVIPKFVSEISDISTKIVSQRDILLQLKHLAF